MTSVETILNYLAYFNRCDSIIVLVIKQIIEKYNDKVKELDTLKNQYQNLQQEYENLKQQVSLQRQTMISTTNDIKQIVNDFKENYVNIYPEYFPDSQTNCHQVE
ncbi:hypothetical protein QJ850_gp386 [Acanthamoeba polyphaga mimivirus]|uniref:Uncharacterized protein n=1 Tax=Acanthamoeba polyphaga mimivirus Kroon TaxID=3069720 RepID=A0A0G2Y3F4_9VIRU|nr:hypothetical protein QJ850_gp386 [Acanthamoeba polyphaga mimivirus]AKI80313.1 hypothetical protein [Acanthamoeba polyphaga mimivirus Kroon]